MSINQGSNRSSRITAIILLLLANSQVDSVAARSVNGVAAKPAAISKSAPTRAMPDFGSMRDVKTKKAAFFEYMKSVIDAENRKIAADRLRIKQLSRKATLNKTDKAWLTSMAKKYRLSLAKKLTPQWYTALLERVDTLPVSLALAQAANESAWGTSRFARKGNNLFGQWCFSKGCGLVPMQRNKGASHEVRKFDSVAASVAACFLNLNSHTRYAGLRALRARARREDQPVTGIYLSPGLVRYSRRGEAYVRELVAIITGNGLEKYDTLSTASANPEA